MTVIFSTEESIEILQKVKEKKRFTFSHAWYPDKDVGGIAIDDFYLPVFHFQESLPLDRELVLLALSEVLGDKDVKVTVEDDSTFLQNNGFSIAGSIESVMLLCHLVNREYSAEKLAEQFGFKDFKEALIKLEEAKTVQTIGTYLTTLNGVLKKVRNQLVKEFLSKNSLLSKLFLRENRILKILAEMSFRGVHVDKEALSKDEIASLSQQPLDGSYVHTTHNLFTSTGRIYTSKPNLQNIRKDSHILEALTPPTEDYTFLFLDYSQMELRVLAYYSEDPILTKAIEDGRDLHVLTASLLFDGDIGSKEREIGKLVNFAVLYGISPKRLEKQILDICGVTINARDLITQFNESYPEVETFRKEVEETLVETHGIVSTCYGRIGSFPEIESSDKKEAKAAERKAFNFIIQSTAADIFKDTIVVLDKFCKTRHTKSQMIFQVHDEVAFYWHKDETELIPEVVKAMESVHSEIPMKVKVQWSTTAKKSAI